MSWPADDELEALVARFHERTLPKAEWTHAAHLVVGAWHVHRLGPAVALDRLRDGVVRLNQVHGTVNSDSAGYHETITRAYVLLIAAHRAGLPAAAGAGELARSVLAGPLAAGDALLAYYSEARLMSAAARRAWVEPDRLAIAATVA